MVYVANTYLLNEANVYPAFVLSWPLLANLQRCHNSHYCIIHFHSTFPRFWFSLSCSNYYAFPIPHPPQLLCVQLITVIILNFQRRKQAQWVLIEEVLFGHK